MGGGSLLNDLLSDLDAAISANELLTANDDPTDDLFASLKKDLSAPSHLTSSMMGPPGMTSAGAFVLSRQAPVDTATTTIAADTTAGQDAWSAALAQFGGMSLAEEFLAADIAAKKQSQTSVDAKTAGSASAVRDDITTNVLDMVFEEDEYQLNEEARVIAVNSNQRGEEDEEGVDETGGLMALFGASRAKTQQQLKQTVQVEEETVLSKKKEEELMQSPQAAGVKAPPPSPMFPPPMIPPNNLMPMGGVGAPGMMNYGGPLPPPHHHMMPPLLPPHMMTPNMMPMVGMMPPPPPGAMPPHVMGRPPPHMMPPNYGSKPVGPPGVPQQQDANKRMFKNREFPALGATPQEIEESKAANEEETDLDSIPPTTTTTNNNTRVHILFNNPDPTASPINANLVSSTSMPSRDITFVVNAMMRPLASLDAYNDDYYHWSYVDRKSRNMLMLGGVGPALPNPVWKEVKVEAKERELKFRESLDARSKEFAEEKKSLGRLVKSNVNRPKALLVTPAMKREEEDISTDITVDNTTAGGSGDDYEAEQKRLRIQTWKARVAIDKGYTAFLTLTELRRLIQANAGATTLIHELTGDVKANVNLMHASFGVVIKNDEKGRKIEVDTNRLESTLSMPKGRILFARVVEGGILPHASACELLPVAMLCIFKNALPAAEGEVRLLRALTGLVLTVQPSVEPAILAKCLDVAIAVGCKDVAVDGKKMTNITGERGRMELLHAILARGKIVCGDNETYGWGLKEKQFMALLT
ncbi:hypothetical protein ACHAWO_000017 [Cyclotella atomus]|uniref:Uncharacterized protein n=1 Tax=Cyclotella atomus TaxID=382360 RepID=A0ABD3QJ62_9STRA